MNPSLSARANHAADRSVLLDFIISFLTYSNSTHLVKTALAQARVSGLFGFRVFSCNRMEPFRYNRDFRVVATVLCILNADLRVKSSAPIGVVFLIQPPQSWFVIVCHDQLFFSPSMRRRGAELSEL